MNLQPQDFNVGYREATNIVLLYSLAEKHHSLNLATGVTRTGTFWSRFVSKNP